MSSLPQSLGDWLALQLAGPRAEIVLGLERVRAVAEAMHLARPAPVVITVAGTNGKGSTVAFVDAIARAAGYRVGSYTSPHLIRYNERIRIGGAEVEDAAICAAFERIEQARLQTGVRLTFFEYGTLAALDLFVRARLDLAVLEVGLGGRLDAVNIVDADVAVVTGIDLDHQDWLGNDRDAIAREKAGIFRRGAFAVLAERAPVSALRHRAVEVESRIVAAGVDYDWTQDRGAWTWRNAKGRALELPTPGLRGPRQLGNASAAIAALDAVGDRLPIDAAAFAQGVQDVRLRARLENVRVDERDVLLDVGHNPQAARVLNEFLRQGESTRPVVAVFGCLADKDTASIVAALRERVLHWYCAGLDGETARGLSGPELAQRVREAGASASAHATVTEAWKAACRYAPADARVVAFGSFYLVSALMRELDVGGEGTRSDAAPGL